MTLNIAIGRLEAGESQYVVAQHNNVHMSTVFRLWQRYYKLGHQMIGRELVICVLQLHNRGSTYTYFPSTQQDSYSNKDSFKHTWPSQNIRTNSLQSPARSWTARHTLFWSHFGQTKWACTGRMVQNSSEFDFKKLKKNLV
jgi:hypothetical protein